MSLALQMAGLIAGGFLIAAGGLLAWSQQRRERRQRENSTTDRRGTSRGPVPKERPTSKARKEVSAEQDERDSEATVRTLGVPAEITAEMRESRRALIRRLGLKKEADEEYEDEYEDEDRDEDEYEDEDRDEDEYEDEDEDDGSWKSADAMKADLDLAMKATAKTVRAAEPQALRRCEVCGNEYGMTFEVHVLGVAHVFDCFACAIHRLAPICEHCRAHIINRGVEVDGHWYCSAYCAQVETRMGSGASASSNP